MKNSISIKTSICACVALLVFSTSACDFLKKKKPAVAPVADVELQSTIDASFATFLVSDVDMICSFVGENIPPKFYEPSPNSYITPTQGNIVINRNPATKYLFVGFNRTLCYDGHMRDGTVSMKYDNSAQTADYYRDYGFYGQITLLDYKVDGWLIRTVGGRPCYVYNLLGGVNYNPATTKLSWLIDGSFEFIHPTDPSRNMVWTGKLTKTLANSTQPGVFDPTKQKAINWSLGYVEYTGSATGQTSGNVPFSLTINERRPLVRDFTCFPNKIGGVEAPAMKAWNLESHPFIGGVAELKTGDLYPRQIYYASDPDAAGTLPCDNSGAVLIKGNTHKIDFLQ